MRTKGLVGLVSYNVHSNHMNYGAALHSWAFQRVLERFGQESVIIDYFPHLMEGYSIKWPILNNLRFWHPRTFLLDLVRWGLGTIPNLRKYKKFERFFGVNLTKTKACYSYSQLLRLSNIEALDISTFVCESDVIWKLYGEGGFDEVFFLKFPAAEGRNKIAYSPSLGSRPFTKDEERRFIELTEDFRAISTREEQGGRYLSALLYKDIPWVLDPTLLLNHADYQKITVKPKERGYVLLYNCMVNDLEMVREAERFAQEHHKVLIEISNWYDNKFRFRHSVKTDVGIEEFLGYMENADFVICNAFHGFCFSVVFRKQMFLFQRDESDFRMKNITDALGLSARLIPWNLKKLPTEFDVIDFVDVYSKLETHRKRSFEFIKDNILIW